MTAEVVVVEAEVKEATLSTEVVDKKDGYIRDYISGTWVRATPEEVDAVQVYAQRLVEDYGYSKDEIQTRPQYRVRRSPSDEGKSYPVDIAVFNSDKKIEENLYIIVECKKKNRKDGVTQLKRYLDHSPATIGVWFNGGDHVYLRKVFHKEGVDYTELPNIPRKGQRIEDIGLYKRKDLKPPSNLKATFKDLRNHLAGNVTGITRDEALAQEIINILFCKIYDEITKGQNDMVDFRCGNDEDPNEVRERVLDLFAQVKEEYNDVFSEEDTIKIDATSLVYIVGELQTYSITEADRDAIGDAFETFIGPALRGAEGQFFTPRNVVKMIVEILDPEPEEMIIDPACGSGGFLITALEYVWKKIEAEGKEKGWTDVRIDRRKRDVATRYFRGLDKDSFLAKVTKSYMALVGDGRGGVFCENSLQPPSEWSHSAQSKIKLGTFSIVMTNPPFGTRIPIKGEHLLSQYDLGHKWRKNAETGEQEKTNTLHEDQPPQILFIERCLQLLKRGGRMGIVLPESIFGMPTYSYVLTYLTERTKILGVISMPEALFKTSGKGGTHAKVAVVFIEKTVPEEDYEIFMADAKWCGHDSRGNRTIRIDSKGNETLLDDVPLITEKYKVLMKGGEE
jgi:type I restriction enzyme M protein